jgi:hypothetical protein
MVVLANDRHGVSSLQMWDAAWYHDLGVDGYGPYGEGGSRFFPLLPGITTAGALVGLPAAAWLQAVCWVAALLFGAALYRLTVLETGDEAAARRCAWLIQLIPGANVLAFGYTEAVAGLLAVVYFLVLRHGGDARIGFVAGALSGLARPTGPVLAVAGGVEALRHAVRGLLVRLRQDDTAVPAVGHHPNGGSAPAARGQRPSRAAGKLGRAVLLAAAPLVGTAAYLGWAWIAFGDPLTPYRVQAAGDLRGGVVRAPWEFLTEDSPGGYRWQFLLVTLAVAAVALLLCAWRLPLAYAAWSVAMVGLAVTAWGLHSLPRYLAAVFPLWMAVALVCRNRWVWWALLALSTAGFTWVAYLNLLPGGPVP